MSATAYPDYMASYRRKKKPCYEGYTGNKVWNVRHPNYGMVEVLAPSKQAAIAAAAAAWSCQWHKYEFYSLCEVRYSGTEKKQGGK